MIGGSILLLSAAGLILAIPKNQQSDLYPYWLFVVRLWVIAAICYALSPLWPEPWRSW